jgi:hypothetical protein
MGRGRRAPPRQEPRSVTPGRAGRRLQGITGRAVGLASMSSQCALRRSANLSRVEVEGAVSKGSWSGPGPLPVEILERLRGWVTGRYFCAASSIGDRDEHPGRRWVEWTAGAIGRRNRDLLAVCRARGARRHWARAPARRGARRGGLSLLLMRRRECEASDPGWSRRVGCEVVASRPPEGVRQGRVVGLAPRDAFRAQLITRSPPWT